MSKANLTGPLTGPCPCDHCKLCASAIMQLGTQMTEKVGMTTQEFAMGVAQALGAWTGIHGPEDFATARFALMEAIDRGLAQGREILHKSERTEATVQ